jgi:hypothetical protein
MSIAPELSAARGTRQLAAWAPGERSTPSSACTTTSRFEPLPKRLSPDLAGAGCRGFAPVPLPALLSTGHGRVLREGARQPTRQTECVSLYQVWVGDLPSVRWIRHGKPIGRVVAVPPKSDTPFKPRRMQGLLLPGGCSRRTLNGPLRRRDSSLPRSSPRQEPFTSQPGAVAIWRKPDTFHGLDFPPSRLAHQ